VNLLGGKIKLQIPTKYVNIPHQFSLNQRQ